MSRANCDQCRRAQSTCICALAQPIFNLPEVLTLQHPLERNQAKGSAVLLHLCLTHSQLQEGEEFAEESLRSWLYAEGKTPILLYPSTEMGQAIAASALTNPSQLRLVLLDATWRKSRKMLFRNPLLQSLPRLALTDMPSPRYAIRKAHALDQLSSFEACCYALMQLEKNEEKYALGLRIFDDFIAQMQRQAAQHSAEKSAQ